MNNNEESFNWDEVIREANALPADYMAEAFGKQSTHYLTLAMNATDQGERDRYLALCLSFTEAAFAELGKEGAA
ncbi:hypothetical protein [Microbacterium maritypicum]|uniref:Uncharacterized protein n=1 Tax=Microbacterium maritypicum MF109 TaxID=1333857 RepID=T5KLR3_MICMQ|nr:hypothetical protein [Microbacterium liquefaciens]EQM78199.1 hypothetical protein L687_16870 [Microbacterium maritypicum MF109]